MARKVVVVALGGNAIKQANEKGTAEEQFNNVYTTCRELVKILEAGYRLVITHGNGPQAGDLLIQQEEGTKVVPAQPLDVVGAMTQGAIGYMFTQALSNLTYKARMPIPVAAIVNQVMVSENDPDYQNPSKPVGPFFTKEEAEKLKQDKPAWIIKQVKPDSVVKRYRRVVASPDPIRNVEYIAVRRMLDAGIVVIASGGGGIPVVLDETDNYKGTAAVIDKDLAGEKLAEVVGADLFLILTDVENACLNYGKPNEQKIGRISYSEMSKLRDEGHFLAGSMGPKVKAALRFIKYGGNRSIITALDRAYDAMHGDAGTQIYPDPV